MEEHGKAVMGRNRRGQKVYLVLMLGFFGGGFSVDNAM
jgi:hypothetical protein